MFCISLQLTSFMQTLFVISKCLSEWQSPTPPPAHPSPRLDHFPSLLITHPPSTCLYWNKKSTCFVTCWCSENNVDWMLRGSLLFFFRFRSHPLLRFFLDGFVDVLSRRVTPVVPSSPFSTWCTSQTTSSYQRKLKWYSLCKAFRQPV